MIRAEFAGPLLTRRAPGAEPGANIRIDLFSYGERNRLESGLFSGLTKFLKLQLWNSKTYLGKQSQK